MQKISFLVLLILSITACGSDTPEETTVVEEDGNSVNITLNDEDGNATDINVNINDVEGSVKDAINELGNSLNITINDENGEAVEVMNFRDIKAVLPKRLLGMERTRHTGEKNGAFGISVSQAEATYEEDDSHLKVQVVDGGGIAIAKLVGAAWTSVEIDKESDDGYERTTTIDGYKAFEKWDNNQQRGEIKWLYKDRYIVAVEGRGLSDKELMRALQKLDLDDLE